MCPHVAQCVWDFLISREVEVIPHTPYGADLAPRNFSLFPTGKRDLKGCHFESPQAVLGAAETAFKHLTQN